MAKQPLIESFPRAEAQQVALFSILIPSWNNLGYLKACIASLQKNSRHSHQVIIHINEGTDGTLQWVRESGFDYTYSAQNAGVCLALNAMAALVRTNYIVYLNDDMYVCPGWDAPLLGAIEARADNLFYYSGTMIEFDDTGNKAVLSPHDFGRTLETFDEAALLNFAADVKSRDWFGSCWPPSIVHRSLWEKAGGYSVEFSPGFYSDPDFAMKLWQLGVRDFRGIGSSLVYHFKCRSTGRVIRNDGRKTFAKKWGIPSSFFYKKVLRMGETYDPSVKLKFPTGAGLLFAKLKAWYIGRN